MGRKKIEPEHKPTYITCGFYPEEWALIERTMKQWRCTQSAAIRLLVREGGLKIYGPEE